MNLLENIVIKHTNNNMKTNEIKVDEYIEYIVNDFKDGKRLFIADYFNNKDYLPLINMKKKDIIEMKINYVFPDKSFMILEEIEHPKRKNTLFLKDLRQTLLDIISKGGVSYIDSKIVNGSLIKAFQKKNDTNYIKCMEEYVYAFFLDFLKFKVI